MKIIYDTLDKTQTHQEAADKLVEQLALPCNRIQDFPEMNAAPERWREFYHAYFASPRLERTWTRLLLAELCVNAFDRFIDDSEAAGQPIALVDVRAEVDAMLRDEFTRWECWTSLRLLRLLGYFGPFYDMILAVDPALCLEEKELD